MRLWIIVPCKPFGEAKRRLARYLSTEARAQLSAWLLEHTLRVVRDLPAAGCVVVSRDPAALARATAAGALAIPEEGRTLNRALRQAIAVAQAGDAQAVLVLPTDLPRLVTADLETLVATIPAPPCVVIAAAERGGGTNALLMAPPGVIAPAFGRASRRRHEERAREAGAALHVVHGSRLAADLDTLLDLRELSDMLPAGLIAPGRA